MSFDVQVEPVSSFDSKCFREGERAGLRREVAVANALQAKFVGEFQAEFMDVSRRVSALECLPTTVSDQNVKDVVDKVNSKLNEFQLVVDGSTGLAQRVYNIEQSVVKFDTIEEQLVTLQTVFGEWKSKSQDESSVDLTLQSDFGSRLIAIESDIGRINEMQSTLAGLVEAKFETQQSLTSQQQSSADLLVRLTGLEAVVSKLADINVTLDDMKGDAATMAVDSVLAKANISKVVKDLNDRVTTLMNGVARVQNHLGITSFSDELIEQRLQNEQRPGVSDIQNLDTSVQSLPVDVNLKCKFVPDASARNVPRISKVTIGREVPPHMSAKPVLQYVDPSWTQTPSGNSHSHAAYGGYGVTEFEQPQRQFCITQQHDPVTGMNSNIYSQPGATVGALPDQLGPLQSVLINPCRTSPLFLKPHYVDPGARLTPFEQTQGNREPSKYVRKFVRPPVAFTSVKKYKEGYRTFKEWLFRFEQFAALQQVHLMECTVLLLHHLQGDALSFAHSLDQSVHNSYYALVEHLLDYFDAHSDDRSKRKAIEYIIMRPGDKFETFVYQLRQAAFELYGRQNAQLIDEVVRSGILFRATKPIQVFIADEEAKLNRILSVTEMVNKVRNYESFVSTKEEVYGAARQFTASVKPASKTNAQVSRPNESNRPYTDRTWPKTPAPTAGKFTTSAPAPVDSAPQSNPRTRVVCVKCGRQGHSSESCFQNLSPELRKIALEKYYQNKGSTSQARVGPTNKVILTDPDDASSLSSGAMDDIISTLVSFTMQPSCSTESQASELKTRFVTIHPDLDLKSLQQSQPDHKLTRLIARNLPITLITLDGLQVRAFPDTGAASSIISEKVFLKILDGKSADWKATHIVNVNCQLVGYGSQAEPQKITEMVMLNMLLGHRLRRALFLVDRTSMSDTVLIGWSTLTQYLGNVFPEDIEFVSGIDGVEVVPPPSIKAPSLPISPVITDLSVSADAPSVIVNHNVVNCLAVKGCRIEAQSSKILQCQLDQMSSKTESDFSSMDSLILEPILPSCQLSCAAVHIEPTGKLKVVVDNNTGVDLHIRRGQLIGTVEPCEFLSSVKNGQPTQMFTDVALDANALELSVSAPISHVCPLEIPTSVHDVGRHSSGVEADLPSPSTTSTFSNLLCGLRPLSRNGRNVFVDYYGTTCPSLLTLRPLKVSTTFSYRTMMYLVSPRPILVTVSCFHKPIRLPCRRTPFAFRKPVEEILQGYLDTGIIRPSSSPYAFPIVLVRKKTGKIRICIDFRELNKVTVKNSWPITRCDVLFDSLGSIKAKVFTGLDLRSGYQQCQVQEKDRQKTAFICHKGLYEYCRLPFGLCNSPATFSRMMQFVLSQLPPWAGAKTFHYLDDVLLATDTIEEHTSVLIEVFKVFRQFGLRLNPEKCEFFRAQIVHLGFVLTSTGLKVHDAKVKAVYEYPAPIGVKGLRRFLGLAGYLRRFVKDFAAIAQPLFQLLKKDQKFSWSLDCQCSFDAIKSALCTPPVLVFPDFTAPFVVEVDASYHGFGAVLGQHQNDPKCLQPIAYASRSLHSPEVNYSATHLEAAGVIWAVDHFRAYLTGHKTFIRTDHVALTSVLNCAKPSPKLHRWALLLQEFDLEFVYKPGVANKVADALSRITEPEPCDDRSGMTDSRPVTCVESVPEALITPSSTPIVRPVMSLDTVSKAVPFTPTSADNVSKIHTSDGICVDSGIPIDDVDGVTNSIEPPSLPLDVSALQRTDPFLSSLCLYLEDSELPTDAKLSRKIILLGPCLVVKENTVLYYQGPRDRVERVVVSEGQWRQELIFEGHSSSWAGHFNARITYAKLSKQYWWPSMLSDIHRFISGCVRCAIRQGQGRRPRPDLKSIIVEPKPLFCVGMDLCKYQLNPETNCKYALVIQCYFRKWPEVHALKDIRARTVAHCFVDFVSRHSSPRHVITDQGGQFTGALMQEVFALLRTTHLRTTTYHAQTDGLVERLNRTMQNMLAKTMELHGKEWDTYLPHILLAYRTMPHSSTNESPFYMLHGYDPVPLSDSVFSLSLPSSEIESDNFVTNCSTQLRTVWDMALESISRAQLSQQTQYNKSTRPHSFCVNDRVWKYLPSLLTSKGRKTCNPYIGPYIVTRVDPNRVEITPPIKYSDKKVEVVSPSLLSPASPMIHNEIFWSGQVFKGPRLRREKDGDAIRPEDNVSSYMEPASFGGVRDSPAVHSPQPTYSQSAAPITNSQSAAPVVHSRKRNTKRKKTVAPVQTAVPHVSPRCRLCMVCKTRHDSTSPCSSSINHVSSCTLTTKNIYPESQSDIHVIFNLKSILSVLTDLCADAEKPLTSSLTVQSSSTLTTSGEKYITQCAMDSIEMSSGPLALGVLSTDSLVSGSLASGSLASSSLSMGPLSKKSLGLRCAVVNETLLSASGLQNRSLHQLLLLLRKYSRCGENETFAKILATLKNRVPNLYPMSALKLISLFGVRYPIASVLRPVVPDVIIYVDSVDCVEIGCQILREGACTMQHSPHIFAISVLSDKLENVAELQTDKLFMAEAARVATALVVQSPYFPPVVFNLLSLFTQQTVKYALPKDLLDLFSNGVILLQSSSESFDALFATTGVMLGSDLLDDNNDIATNVLGAKGRSFMLESWMSTSNHISMEAEVFKALSVSSDLLGKHTASQTTSVLRGDVTCSAPVFNALLDIASLTSLGLSYACLHVLGLVESGAVVSPVLMPLAYISQLLPSDYSTYNTNLVPRYSHYRSAVESELGVGLDRCSPCTTIDSLPKDVRRWEFFWNNFTINMYTIWCQNVGVVLGTMALLVSLERAYKTGIFPPAPGFHYYYTDQVKMKSNQAFAQWTKLSVPIENGFVNVFNPSSPSNTHEISVNLINKSTACVKSVVQKVVSNSRMPRRKSPERPSGSAQGTSKVSSAAKPKSIFCTYCRRPNHTFDRCFDRERDELRRGQADLRCQLSHQHRHADRRSPLRRSSPHGSRRSHERHSSTHGRRHSHERHSSPHGSRQRSRSPRSHRLDRRRSRSPRSSRTDYSRSHDRPSTSADNTAAILTAVLTAVMKHK